MPLTYHCTTREVTSPTVETSKFAMIGKFRGESYRIAHALNRQTTRYSPKSNNLAR